MQNKMIGLLGLGWDGIDQKVRAHKLCTGYTQSNESYNNYYVTKQMMESGTLDEVMGNWI